MINTSWQAIKSTIINVSQSVVTGTSVTAVNVATNVSYKGISDASGNYAISLIPPGEYAVEISAQERPDIMLQVNQVIELDLLR